MTQKQTGGPAFPIPATEGYHSQMDGMTLRDYFARQADGLDDEATASYAAHFNRDPQPEAGDMMGWAKWCAKADATLRYINADAMIAARDE